MELDHTVRPARPSDIGPMCDLLSELFSIEADFTPDRTRQSLGLGLLLNDASGSSAVFVAEADGEVVGMCTVQTLVSTAQGGAVGLLEDLVVRKDRRGRGVGSSLLSHAHSHCAERGITRLQLLRDADNSRALEFYERNGWSGTSLLCMRKLL